MQFAFCDRPRSGAMLPARGWGRQKREGQAGILIPREGWMDAERVEWTEVLRKGDEGWHDKSRPAASGIEEDFIAAQVSSKRKQ